MQTLYLMRGPQGSGKSTFLRDNALMPWTLSFDALRLMYGSMEMGRYGEMGATQSNDERMFHRFKEMLDFRMSMGQTTFVDATHMDNDFDLYEKLSKQWAYSVKIIEFGMNLSADELMRRIDQRSIGAPENYVPRQAVERTQLKLQNRTTPEWITVVTPEQAALELNAGPENLSDQYSGIVFVGDIQGSATALKHLLDKHYDPKKLMLFTGDLFDRGAENGEVMLIMQDMLARDNTRLINGNHERHLLTWRNGGDTPTEFWKRTLPQLKKNGFDTDVANFFISKGENLIQFQFADALFQVNHGGAPSVIERPALFSGQQCWKGVGFFEDSVDDLFEANSKAPWHQVHGHRNALNRDLRADQRSFNLEENVEFGGNLRALDFDGEKFTPIHITNRVFVPMSQRDLRHSTMIPSWSAEQNEHHLSAEKALEPCLLTEQELDDLRHHELIKESVQKETPHISSFNFTREAFYSQSYDTCNMRARGLYINTESREVVIRGYDKYFNVNERGIAQAQLSEILANTKPPYSSTIKENGYLGLIGYDSQMDTLVYASKSTTTGDHALWLKDQVMNRLNETQRNVLKNTLRDYQLSLTFEVIEPVNDPHIVAYDAPNIVLLDGIRRTLAFEKISHEDLLKIGKAFGFDCKEKGPMLPNKTALAGFLSAASKKGFTHNHKEIEGLVLEDSTGTMFKLKLPYYNLWKMARGASMAVNRFHEKGTEVKPHFLVDPVVAVFVEWLKTKEPAMAKQDIITLREAFLVDHPELSKSASKHFVIEADTSPAP